MSRNNHKPNILQKARAKFIELYSRVIELSENSKDDKVYWNGENNLYPNEIERVILNSPTGVLASKLMAKYIAGVGVEGNDEVVNSEKKLKLTDLIKLGSSNISRQNGVYFHIGYELNETLNFRKNIDILDYTKTRKGKEFENGSDSRYIFKDFCENKGILSKKTISQWYWPYTTNEKILIAQIKADYFEETEQESDDLSLMLPFFRGQVYYLNLTPEFKYALSPFDAVFNDLDTEFRISMYINRNFRSGFLGKTSVIVAGLDEEDEKQVEEDVKNWLGSENSGGVYYLSVASADDIDKVITFKQVKSDLDEKMFEKTVLNVEDKIIGAANNAPKALVKSQDSMFGQSSSTYIEMKKFYTENTEEERSKLEQAITYLGYPCKIIPVVKITKDKVEDVQDVEVDDATKQAQANLRGSVGGVTGVLQVQTSFSQGLTDYQSAITIFTEIYGFTQEVADALLGNPEKIETDESQQATV